ncbi:MAG TPA: HigA family addiction module antitoxin [Sphingomicrobium sp.]|nr:HigA family addiction module antitoxin [Sphingomicrobium sp.]
MSQMVQRKLNPPMPGDVLRQKLVDELGIKQARVARAIGISAARLNMTLNGRCPISPEIALRIEKVFGISSGFWLNLRAEFELFQERQRISNELNDLGQWG